MTRRGEPCYRARMNQQQPPNAPAPAPGQGHQGRAVAQPPNGATAKPGQGEVLYQGIAKQSASLGGYLKWGLVSVVCGGLAIVINVMDWGIPGWALGLLWLVGLPGILWTYLDHVSSKYKITAKRVETEHGVLAKKVDSIEMWRVLDVSYSQSLLDRLFDNGRISIKSTDQTHPELDLHGLPNHRQLYEQLRDAVQDARQTNRPMELVGGDFEGANEMA